MSDLEDSVSSIDTDDVGDDRDDEDEHGEGDETEGEGEDIQDTSDETDGSDVLESEGNDSGAAAVDSNGSPPLKRSRRIPAELGPVITNTCSKDRVIALLKAEVLRLRAKRDRALDEIVHMERSHLRTLSFLASQASAMQEHARMMTVNEIARGRRAAKRTT